MKNIYGVSGLLILVAVFALGCGDVSDQASTEAAAAASPREDAPDFTLKDVEDRDVKLSDYEGKVVLLNFWATWCGPCKIEMPWFVEFQRKYKDRGFSVIAVSMDEEGWDVVRPFLEDLKPNFPGGDRQRGDGRRFRRRGGPADNVHHRQGRQDRLQPSGPGQQGRLRRRHRGVALTPDSAPGGDRDPGIAQ